MMFVTDIELAQFLDDKSLENNARARLLLELASDLVRENIDQHVTVVTDDVLEVFDVGGLIVLPELPVTAVTQIETVDDIDGTTAIIDPSTYQVDLKAGVIRRLGVREWSATSSGDLATTVGDEELGTLIPPRLDLRFPRHLKITYTHGNQRVPSGMRTVVFRVVARAIYNPTGVRQESVGAWSQTAGGGQDPGLYLTPADMRTLDRYRPGKRAS